MQAEAEVCRDVKDALAEAPGRQGVVGNHGWLERGKEEACSLHIIPMEIKKGKSYPLGDEKSPPGGSVSWEQHLCCGGHRFGF